MSLELASTRWGRFLVYSSDLTVGAALLKGEAWDPWLLPLIEAHALPGTVAIDGGAHVGFFSVQMARRGARVFAFEPQHVLALLASTNALLNGFPFPKIGVSTFGLSDDSDKNLVPAEKQLTDLADWDYEKMPSPGSIAFSPTTKDSGIATTTLDERLKAGRFGDSRVSFVKLDLQGMELFALMGARKLLTTDRPVVVFEWEAELAKAHGHSWEDVEFFLDLVGYTFTHIEESGNDFLAVPSVIKRAH